MNTTILVTYATRYGSTGEVAEAVAATLREQGAAVDLKPMNDVQTLDGYNAVVMGAALYMYHWPKDALRFLARHRAALAERPVAVFALGPVHDPRDEQEWQTAHAQLDQELNRFAWLTPVAVALFGGRFDPAKLRFPLNVLAGQAPASDARDWEAIRVWAHDLAAMLAPEVPEQAVSP